MRNRRTSPGLTLRLPHRGMLLPMACLLIPGPLAAQGRIIDEGVLRVRIGRAEVAREEFSITQGGSFDGRLGYRITATAFYPPRRTRVVIAPAVDIGADSQPRLVEFEARTADAVRTIAQIGPGRLTIRRFWRGGENFIEYRSSSRVLVVDDSVFALYAIPPGLTPGDVLLVAPRTEVRLEARLDNLGRGETVVDGRRYSLLHLVLTAGTDTRHLWYNDDGRLMKVEIPSRGLSAERVASGRGTPGEADGQERDPPLP